LDVSEYARYEAFRPDGRRLEVDELPLVRAIRGELVADEEIAIICGDGSPRWLVVNASPIRDRDDRIVAGVVTLLDVTERRRHQEQQRFLAEASEQLGASLDYEEALRRIVRLAVPDVADWCLVDLLDADGQLVTV